MAISGIIFFLAVLAVLGLSIWGLFNKNRSILCILAGIAVVLFSIPGGLHAWGEGRSIPWTVGYGIAGLIGAISVIRQIMPRKPMDTET